MAKYSRMKRYQGLRESLDRETTQQQKPSTHKNMERLSRVASANQALSHANQPQRVTEQPIHTVGQGLPTSPVMNDLLDEVKQYNLDNGNSVSDDTQINILKQLDGTQTMRRNSHFIPMEQQEEDLGSTMELPIQEIPKEVKKAEKPKVSSQPDYGDGTDILPMRETPLPVHPVVDEPAPEPVKQATKEKIVLTHDDFDFDSDIDSEESYDGFEYDYTRSNQEPESKPEPKPKPKKKGLFAHKDKPKPVKETKVEPEVEVEEEPEQKPVVKKKPKPKQKPKKKQKPVAAPKPKNKTGMILNIVLAILVILLIVAISATVMMVKSLGA